MKKTLTGWIGKSGSVKENLFRNGYTDHIELQDTFFTRGLKGEWPAQDWPPIKVKVTVEMVEK